MIREVEEAAKALCLPNPYHNATHADTVWRRVQVLIERCRKFGLDPNEEVLHHSSFIHDILTGMDFRSYGCRSAEALSAQSGMRMLISCGVEATVARESARTVMGTHPESRLVTLEQKILRAADLGGLAGSFNDYLEDFYALKAEAIEVDDFAFFAKSLKLLTRYLVRTVRLTPEYFSSNGASDWHTKTIGNLIKNYLRITAIKGINPLVSLDLGCGAYPIAIWRQMGNAFVIGAEPDSRLREDGLKFVLSRKDLVLPELIVPGVGKALPIPDHSLDRVVMANTALIHGESLDQQELQRVLKSRSELEIMEWLSPGLGFGEDFVKAKQYLRQILSEEFDLESESDLSDLKGANSDAFSLTFRKRP